MADSPSSWLEEGVAAAQAGDAERARACLLRVVEVIPDGQRNVQAWYWLSRVVRSPQEREICLENVLALDPGHTAVQAELAELRRQQIEGETASLLSREAIAAAVPRTVEEELVADAAVEPLRCPYCDALTQMADRQCSACGHGLYVRERKSRDHSIYSLGLVAIWFALANLVWFALFAYVLQRGCSQAIQDTPGLQHTLNVVSDWLGFGGAGVPAVDLPLTPVLLAGGLLFVFCLLVTWGLYLRLSFFYWLTIVLLLLGPLATVYGAAQAAAPPLLLFAVEAVLCLLALGFAFMAHDEFAWVERHLATVGRAVDKDVDSPSALYARGRKYAEQEMWARAAAHWSRAVALSPGHPEYRLALATAYVNLGQPERAVEHLDKAQEIEPGNRQARDLLASLQLDR